MYARPSDLRALGNHPVSTIHLTVEILCYHPVTILALMTVLGP